MIGIGSESRIHASKHASLQLKSWEQILSLRISLQKVLESANKIPTTDTNNEFISNESSELLESLSVNLYKMLEVSTGIESSYDESEGPIRWEQIDDLQFTSQEHWRDVLNKWHSRLQFGSKEAVSRMKTFKQTFYEQVDAALADNQRVIEKSRATWNESPRLLKDESIQENSSYDIEVYEDRQFYSLLLKSFISQQASGASGAGMSKADIDVIRKFKKPKSKVERKASKGRKVRYTTHPKLQNFMFPLPPVVTNIDATKLFQSLFQS